MRLGSSSFSPMQRPNLLASKLQQNGYRLHLLQSRSRTIKRKPACWALDPRRFWGEGIGPFAEMAVRWVHPSAALDSSSCLVNSANWLGTIAHSHKTGQTWKLSQSSVILFITFHQSSIPWLILGAVLRGRGGSCGPNGHHSARDLL